MEAGNTTSSQEPWNGPQPLQPIATSEHSQQLQQRASFDGPKQTQVSLLVAKTHTCKHVMCKLFWEVREVPCILLCISIVLVYIIIVATCT